MPLKQRSSTPAQYKVSLHIPVRLLFKLEHTGQVFPLGKRLEAGDM